MGRPKRAAQAGYIYHVLNRANARMTIFETDEDYAAFERILSEAVERFEMRLLSYCVMPNHWHLVVHPSEDGQLSRFTGWLTLTHTQRWHAHRQSTGSGHVYQGRFKSFPIQGDEHFYTVCRYVERNAFTAKLVKRAEDWRWGSLYHWKQGAHEPQPLLSSWPQRRKPGWAEYVNQPLTEREVQALERSIQRGAPFGDEEWTEKTVQQLDLASTIKPRGRPRKTENGS
ncbi:Transposase IS200 like protein [Gimesia maris]|jgi:putative transposase|uniref:transposase n=1 Tax=Gimesia maris TaxID=122 RepID=UPI001187C219|nr:transposase [Gimesia maris]QDT77085.1 Transposase IS200 like protein [Gimesia maris]